MQVHRLTLVGVGLFVATAVVSLALLPLLPAEVAIHFGLGGEPDSFVSAPAGVLLLPGIGLATLVATRATGSLGIGTSAPPVFDPLLATFLGYVQALVLAYNLGMQINVSMALAPALVTFVVVVFLIQR
ncbi:DUF1648 domain-containing protein [Haloferax sp. S1W]|uniref:DUF1648 domain-containing protein n=1 Tax=Haloferax sp. S1W TaxID=3377110 RepID=UPI0037C82284